MKDIGKALYYMLSIANNDEHGYDQTHRNGPDFDCSSLIGHALNYAGFNVYKESWTGNLYKQLIEDGFTFVNPPYQPGDIHLTPGHHVCMHVGCNKIVHARINEYGKTTGGKTGDQTGNEITITDYYTPSYGWKYHLRYTDQDKIEEDKTTLQDDELYTKLAKEVIQGKWSVYPARQTLLEEAGYDYKRVQNYVNMLMRLKQATNYEKED